MDTNTKQKHSQTDYNQMEYGPGNGQLDTRSSQHEPSNAVPLTRKPHPATRSTQRELRNSQSAVRKVLPATRKSQHEPRSPRLATRDPQPVYALDLGLIDYLEAWELQQKLVNDRVEKTIGNDMMLFLEHPAVFTLGRRGGRENLLVSESFLKDHGIPVVQVERGGFITYHGPGQIVVYPIISLHARRIGVKEFVAAMEEAMIQTAARWKVPAERNSLNSGVWVGSRKMGSIGIALRKGISFHGLALNVNLDLTPFSWVQPCGLQGVGMTSMKQELDQNLPMDEVLVVLKDQLKAALGISFEDCSLPDLAGRL
jgi:lipoate-protein ligase B